MTNIVLIFLQICLDVGAELAWVLWLLHDDSEAVEIVIVDFGQIDTLKAAEHVIDGDEASLVFLEVAINLQVRFTVVIFDLKLGLRDATVLGAIRVDVKQEQILVAIGAKIE